jgi:hypothetical protein
MKLFGFEFKRQDQLDPAPSFAPKEADDGALVVAAGGAYGTYIDLDGTVRTEAELVTKYREMSLQPEIDMAVDEIINESISIDEEDIVNINLDNVNIPNRVKKAIQEEFNIVLKLLDFNMRGYEIYRRWYIDGRLYYHAIISKDSPQDGLLELRYVDPRKIRKVREIGKKRAPGGADGSEAVIPKTQNEYYVYNDKGFNYGNKVVGPSTAGMKIAKDSIVHVTSGLTDTQGTMVLSYLHKAIKPLNQLRTLEDSLIIYRLARAPERRIWYIDVGNLPKMKAEQYVRDIMVKHKNRLIYDASTGEVRDDRKFMTMLEDYWLPRREGGRGTEVTTLPGGQTLGEMDDVLYFQKKLYQTLNVPVNRLNSDALFSIGRATEVTRDELKFYKFITRIRGRFSALFNQVLEKQLVLKGIMSIEEWQQIVNEVKYDFARDNYFTELKDAEIMQNRAQLMMTIEQGGLIGKYYSHQWARRQILRQSDEDIEEQDKAIEEEQNDPKWAPPELPGAGGMSDGDQPVQDDQTTDQITPDDNDNDKIKALKQAMLVKKQMEEKGSENRSIQDESKYRSAIMLLSKNKQITDNLSI